MIEVQNGISRGENVLWVQSECDTYGTTTLIRKRENLVNIAGGPCVARISEKSECLHVGGEKVPKVEEFYNLLHCSLQCQCNNKNRRRTEDFRGDVFDISNTTIQIGN